MPQLHGVEADPGDEVVVVPVTGFVGDWVDWRVSSKIFQYLLSNIIIDFWMHTLDFFPSGKETRFDAKPIRVKLYRHWRAWANKVIWYKTITSISTVFPWVVIKRYLQVVVDASTIHMWLNVNVFNSEFNLCIIAAGLKLPCLQIFQYKISLH